jgi:hypothetical protein
MALVLESPAQEKRRGYRWPPSVRCSTSGSDWGWGAALHGERLLEDSSTDVLGAGLWGQWQLQACLRAVPGLGPNPVPACALYPGLVEGPSSRQSGNMEPSQAVWSCCSGFEFCSLCYKYKRLWDLVSPSGSSSTGCGVRRCQRMVLFVNTGRVLTVLVPHISSCHRQGHFTEQETEAWEN